MIAAGDEVRTATELAGKVDEKGLVVVPCLLTTCLVTAALRTFVTWLLRVVVVIRHPGAIHAIHASMKRVQRFSCHLSRGMTQQLLDTRHSALRHLRDSRIITNHASVHDSTYSQAMVRQSSIPSLFIHSYIPVSRGPPLHQRAGRPGWETV